MATEEPTPGLCGASCKNAEGYCALIAGYGTDHEGDGRCKFHGGCGGSDTTEPGSNYAETHGLHSKRSNYYDNRPAEEKAWIDKTIQSMLDDAPFTKDDFQKFGMLRNIAIDMHKLRRANDYIDEEGLVSENVVRGEDGEPIVNQSGEVVTQPDENPVNLAYDRLNRTMTKQLKELGLLDDPDSQQAEANASIAEELSEMRNNR